MKINKRKVAKRFLMLAVVLLIAVYCVEYKCALMRPLTGCSAVCEDRTSVLAMVGNKPVESHICLPIYYKWIGK